jgi:hypothetical protein
VLAEGRLEAADLVGPGLARLLILGQQQGISAVMTGASSAAKAPLRCAVSARSREAMAKASMSARVSPLRSALNWA